MPWFEPSGSAANDTELLFIALLLCQSVAVTELKEWVHNVRKLEAQYDELGAAFRLPDETAWKFTGSKPGHMLLPVARVYNGVWSDDNLRCHMRAHSQEGRVPTEL